MKTLIKKVADSMLSIEKSNFEEKCPISIVDINKWEWAQGVGLYGLYRYYEVTGDKNHLDYIKKWFKDRINEGLPEKCVNTCAPLLTLTFIYDGEKEYEDLMREWALWLMNDLDRVGENGFAHSGSGVVCYDQLWDDTLFMCVLFLARAGILFENNEWLEETKRQFLVHLRYLTDTKTGLMFHGWTFKDQSNLAGALWGRGNAWITVCIPDYIDIMGDKLEAGIKNYLTEVLATQIKALKKYQAPSGMWRTLINHEDSYEEASATAGFGYGIHKAVRLGYVSEEYAPCAAKALDAIKECIGENGVVDKVSYGTGLSYDINYYNRVPIQPMTYGQALTILFLSESMN